VTRLSGALLVLALAAGGAGLTAPGGSAQAGGAAPAATAVIDRTLLCSTLSVGGGLYQFWVRAQDGIRENRTTWRSLAFAAARAGRITIGPSQLDDSLAWAGAGRVSHETNLEYYDPASPYPAQTHGTLAMNQRLCRRIRPAKRVRLTAKGLEGGRAGQLGEEYECSAPRRVLVRVRATLRTRAPMYRERDFVKTKANLESAYLAIRTRSGKPLAFAAVSESGKARLFTASSCISE
jgi:hypothetical protein